MNEEQEQEEQVCPSCKGDGWFMHHGRPYTCDDCDSLDYDEWVAVGEAMHESPNL